MAKGYLGVCAGVLMSFLIFAAPSARVQAEDDDMHPVSIELNVDADTDALDDVTLVFVGGGNPHVSADSVHSSHNVEYRVGVSREKGYSIDIKLPAGKYDVYLADAGSYVLAVDYLEVLDDNAKFESGVTLSEDNEETDVSDDVSSDSHGLLIGGTVLTLILACCVVVGVRSIVQYGRDSQNQR